MLAWTLAAGLLACAVPPAGPLAGDSGAQGPGGSAEQYLSGARLKQRVVTTADGAKGFVGWYDSQLGVDCFFAQASDGSSRCIPAVNVGVAFGDYFADPGCARAAAYYSGAPCRISQPYIWQVVETAACGPAVPVYRVFRDPVIVGDAGVFTHDADGGCYQLDGAPLAWPVTVGAEVDPSALVQGTTQIE